MATWDSLWEWPLLRGIMTFTLVSTSMYTLNVVLAFSCVRHFLAQKASFNSKRRLAVFCVYVFALVAVASEAAIRLNIDMINTIKQSLLTSTDEPTDFRIYPLSLPIAIWGADGILMWRCAILYQRVSRPTRIGVYLLLGSLGLLSLGTGIFPLFPTVIDFKNINANGTISDSSVNIFGGDNPGVLLFLPTTLMTNGTFSILIASRLLYAHHVLSKAQSDSRGHSNQGDPGPYLTALAICVESSTIIFVGVFLSVIACLLHEQPPFYIGNSSFQPAIILTQLCVISPLLIIYRVSQGRSDETISRLEQTLIFHHTQHSAVSQSDTHGV